MDSGLADKNESATEFDSTPSEDANLIIATSKIVPRVIVDRHDATISLLRGEGCFFFRGQCAFIPGDLKSVTLSFVGIGDHEHLSGLDFRSKTGMDAELGYLSTKVTLLYDVETITGSVFAIDPLGIRALQIVDGNGVRPRWFGSSKNVPITEHLVAFDTTEPLRARVDMYKIISITATAIKEIPGESRPGLSSPSLHTTDLWYPSIPSADLLLNDRSFQDIMKPEHGYMPLHWCKFGGPKGAYLRHIVEIALDDGLSPTAIEFRYSDQISIEPAYFSSYKRSPEEMESEPIDGPEGEYLQTVQVVRRGKWISALRVSHTPASSPIKKNIREWGIVDSHLFGSVGKYEEAPAEFKTLEATPGSTITGLYRSLRYTSREEEDNFGVISEMLDDLPALE
ncbi:hypothetical protein N7466_005817 [Penicillium verhagenii]|uniref:uncharacterized protein n=1 Tax=Penicillium verhagenii TaxID=1562060 RepID=UPI002545B70A|nr:uncharacterized protein N7466_005817 [Penicillium verhagenii]KAJ5930324.1 hypothetical protein N7466_005817 [Penicillium verhagenii]